MILFVDNNKKKKKLYQTYNQIKEITQIFDDDKFLFKIVFKNHVVQHIYLCSNKFCRIYI